jgi:hypothetical protein
MVIQDVGSSLVVPLGLEGCMIHFKHRLKTTEEISSLKQYCLTQGHTPWNPSFEMSSLLRTDPEVYDDKK